VQGGACHRGGSSVRRSGEARTVILGYYEGRAQPRLDGHEWLGEAEPAWWLNLQAHPEAVVVLEPRAAAG
jgi:hypothetical protein